MITERRPTARASEIVDLRDWLERADAMGDLRHITQEVDPIEEMGAITYMVGKRIGSPALLFENIKGHPGQGRALFNLLSSSNRRIAMTMGMDEPDRPVMELIQEARQRLSRRLPPVEVDAKTAPVNEIILRGRSRVARTENRGDHCDSIRTGLDYRSGVLRGNSANPDDAGMLSKRRAKCFDA